MERNGVFISYASEDLDYARRMYDDLTKAGLEPWLDKINLLPGQKWQRALKEAIRNSRYFIALISKASTEKIGYVQSEFRQALEILDEFPDTEIYVIPARLDDSTPTHQKLQEIQWVDLFPDWDKGLQKILEAMNIDMEEANSETADIEKIEPVNVSAFVPKFVRVEFDTEESHGTMRERLFAIIVEWVEFGHIKEGPVSLEFPGGKYDRTELALEPDGLPPLADLLSEFGVDYKSIHFSFEIQFDISDLVSRSRGGARNRARLTTSSIVFNVTDYATVTVTNHGESNSSVTVNRTKMNWNFEAAKPPVSYHEVLDYLLRDPVTDALPNAIAESIGLSI